MAAIFTWVCSNTCGSLLLVWLFHASMTITGYILLPLPTATERVLSWMVAAAIAAFAFREFPIAERQTDHLQLKGA